MKNSNPKKNKVESKSSSAHALIERFKKINGDHSLKKKVPGSFVDYPARTRHNGEVAFFNFSLAEEMGLLDKGSPHKLTKSLSKIILDTFAIVIINEYDQQHNVKYPKKDIKPKKYMATRYLQLQHPDNRGKTSGDGRSVWNGEFKHKGISWDISSCGTGATCLSPATAKYGKFFKTGDPSISYGCGYSEIDEGFTTLFFSEILAKNGVPTERVLAVIRFKNGFSITVRARKNLLRPSHFFNHLKQGNLESLRNIVNYYIDKQEQNKEWLNVPTKKSQRYDYFLKKIMENFSWVSAKFEDDYIFCWIDWDGDNILMDGGIIDYGSIRQFGLFHHDYRYDDVDRYSTCIKEQKQKSKYIVQTFVQAIDFLKTGKKHPIHKFNKHKIIKDFDKNFELHKDANLLYKIGFSKKYIPFLLQEQRNLVRKFRDVFSYFEREKSVRGIYKVADGLTHDAIFCMRDILREYPQLKLLHENELLSDISFINIIKSSYATKEDLVLTPSRKKKIKNFQDLYMLLVKRASEFTDKPVTRLLLELTMRSSVINKYDRITGDSITFIVDKVLKAKPSLSVEEIDSILSEFISYQNLDPDKKHQKKFLGLRDQALMQQFVKIVKDNREGI